MLGEQKVSRRVLAKANLIQEGQTKFRRDFVSEAVCNFLAPLKNKASHRGAASVITAINPISTAVRLS